ncbi:hypothetical protein COMA1_11593 [Candidatus Nitrospira nitrosa]|uniref:Uncharacterized protein n=1 Tax=Candidatus Nitrospira nitrosa TaxID=1742972 RepID=A0A0S4LAP1_9BACT|nr:hypothetical protein COMA1_11593 [Candidatus Nitrospira nitrosa]
MLTHALDSQLSTVTPSDIKGGAKMEAANLRPALGPGGGSPSRTSHTPTA